MASFFGGRSSKKNDEPDSHGGMSTAQFISQANEFLNEVEDRSFLNPFSKRDDTMGDMLRWAKHTRDKRFEMRNLINVQRTRLQQAEQHIHGLESVRANMEIEITNLHSMRAKLSREKEEIANEHTRQLTEIAQQQSMEENRHQKKYQEEKNELLRQLLVSQRDDQGWPDDKIKLKFRELQRLMETVTAPRNKEFLIPEGLTLPAHLDRTGFLARVGNSNSHFLLMSTLWSIIWERYFSAPFGFGVFGPGKCQKPLFEMYAAWRRLFDEKAVAASPDNENYGVFKQDVHANNWRSTTFQYISVALTSKEQSDSPIAKLDKENFENTVTGIKTVLSDIANLSQSTIRPEIEDQIRQMVSLGRDIALQFGIQPAHLQLVIPAHGEEIKIGERFHDCCDGDSGEKKTCNVDIVTAPGLQKIGDGRSDMDFERAMVPCEIYPIEDPE